MRPIFWVSLGVLLYVYAGYPLCLSVLGWCRRPSKREASYVPTVSLIIAAHNEEKMLQDKLQNSLALDYPKGHLEILVASDGSTDATNSIARRYERQGVKLREIPVRGGKTRAVNLTVPTATGEILVLSDANTIFRADAVRKLVRHFADPNVGAVSGDVRLENAAESHARPEGLYYRLERWLQGRESEIGSIVGADGGMYALRRRLFCPPSEGIIADDFVISMSVARLGYRVLYEPEAVAIEQGTLSSSEEFRRKARVIAGGIQALVMGEGLPRRGQLQLLFCYVSHKLLRWLTPCFLGLVLVSSVRLVSEPLYLCAVVGQMICYGCAFAYAANAAQIRRLRWAAIPFYFGLTSGAALWGLWKGLSGRQNVVWQRTTR